jgi:soluble lytic murein transglycosylase
MSYQRTQEQAVSPSLVVGLSLACVFCLWAWSMSQGVPGSRFAPSLPDVPMQSFFVMAPRADPAPDPSRTEDVEQPEIPEDPGPRGTLVRVLALADEGRRQDALNLLESVREDMPGLPDLFAVIEGDIRSAGDPDERACEAYRAATSSPNRGVAARARVAFTRCLLALGDTDAERSLEDLLKSYPRLPQRHELHLALARAREDSGDTAGAISIYRAIDMQQPGSPLARRARERLDALATRGVEVAPLSPTQRLARVERLALTGPLEMAHEELRALRELHLTRATRARIELIDAGIARREGRFADARALVRSSLRLSASPDARELEQRLAEPQAAPDPAVEAERARRRIRGVAGGRPFVRLPAARLQLVARLAAQAGLDAEANQALDALLQRRDVPAPVRLDVAMATSGVGDDERLARLLEPVRDVPGIGVTARYYRARALERLGRSDEAASEFERVVADDDGETRFYGFWARQRLTALVARREDGSGSSTETPVRAAVPSPAACRALALDRDRELAARLRPLADEHAEGYPWLQRAVDLIELGRHDDAADELHEAFLAWAESRGRGQLRSGVLSVYRGGYVPRHGTSPQLRQARQALVGEDLRVLADVSAGVGDHGLAVRFGGWSRATARPRAYEELVEAAAARHGVDPALVLAVMRVESVYNPRIISYAGAIGLMQIMPRTGTFIAGRLGDEDFTVDALLEPEVNIELAAWYLASLIERFDGRVPLAVAAYNGGPHNVRLWLSEQPARMPLDAFLETIPFGQTHRYVRRVLTNYEVYRAQTGSHAPVQDITLPAVRPDPVAF